MSIEATHDPALMPAEPARPVIHPRWVRVTHWVNALTMVVLIGSGWQIYNASPLFAFAFPPGSRSEAGSRGRCSGISRRCGFWR